MKNRDEDWKAREKENPMEPGRMSNDWTVYELWSFEHWSQKYLFLGGLLGMFEV